MSLQVDLVCGYYLQAKLIWYFFGFYIIEIYTLPQMLKLFYHHCNVVRWVKVQTDWFMVFLDAGSQILLELIIVKELLILLEALLIVMGFPVLNSWYDNRMKPIVNYNRSTCILSSTLNCCRSVLAKTAHLFSIYLCSLFSSCACTYKLFFVTC